VVAPEPSVDIRPMMKALAELVGTSVDRLEGILFNEHNDWAFIVKTSALVETALSQLVASASDDPRLAPLMQDFASRGGLGQKKNYVARMQLLSDESLAIVDGLNRIRNELVHDIANLEFSLVTYLTTSTDHMNAFVHAFGRLKKPHEAKEVEATAEVASMHPHFLVQMSVVLFLNDAFRANIAIDSDATDRRLAMEHWLKMMSEPEDDDDDEAES
jgi:hypothetical protein